MGQRQGPLEWGNFGGVEMLVYFFLAFSQTEQ